ncbi:WD40/YVTN/BNR-like repeat-containing protein [Aeromicrobium sp. UC242_57]|uniref:WD40/YVTN/BNR-like repeat-containing protein n=1 Tax=Aeromicrobium sp. UC242_57 TaxID=3374624 RepID=UPI0037B62CBD
MKKTLPLVLIAAFVIVDVVLIIGARRHVFQTPPESDIVARPVTPAAATAAPDDAQVSYDFDATRSIAISLANDGALVLGPRTACTSTAERAPITTSLDGGAKVTQVATGLVTVLGARAVSASDLRIVGLDSDCTVREARSSDGGAKWTASAAVSLWYADPKDEQRVVSPTGSGDVGCEVVSVSQITAESARVGCADGSIKGTGDSGTTWTQRGRLDNLRVATFLTPTAGYALARYNGCAANAFTTKDAGVTWQPGGCITGEPAQGIAASANGLAAVVNDGLYVSSNGADWKQP